MTAHREPDMLRCFRNDPLCSCHEPPMAVTLCSASNALDRAFEKYQARKAREAAEEAGKAARLAETGATDTRTPAKGKAPRPKKPKGS